MFIGNTNTIPSIVNLPGQGGGAPFQSTEKFLFDGNDGFLRSTTFTNYRFTDELSISCWVTFGDTITAGDPTTFRNFMIVDQANSSFSQGYSLYVTRLANGNALLRFQIGKGTTDNTNGRAQIRIDNISGINPNKVFLIVASYFNSTTAPNNVCKIELKGVGVDLSNAKTPASGAIAYSNLTNAFCIGNTSPVGNVEFDGSIDEVGVFNKRLINSNTNDIFNWNQNGNLQAYSQANNLNLAAWYRMGENATYAPNTTTYDILAENDDFIITEDGISVVTENFVENLGVWTVKSATNLSDTTKYLVSSRSTDTTIGFLPLTARQQPGLPPPT
jgi:hypothetical protein